MGLRRKSAMDLKHRDKTNDYSSSTVDDRADAAERLAALLKRMDVTPRFEKKLELSAKDLEQERGKDELDQDATRFLLVGVSELNVSRQA